MLLVFSDPTIDCRVTMILCNWCGVTGKGQRRKLINTHLSILYLARPSGLPLSDVSFKHLSFSPACHISIHTIFLTVVALIISGKVTLLYYVQIIFVYTADLRMYRCQYFSTMNCPCYSILGCYHNLGSQKVLLHFALPTTLAINVSRRAFTDTS